MKSNILAFSVSLCVALVTCGVSTAQEVKTKPTPPAVGSTKKTTPPAVKTGKATKDIVDTAVAAGNFKTLAAALKAAGLVETLKGKGPFTVFAPTDAAFAKLPKETLADLLKPASKAKLTKILTYHVLPKEETGQRFVRDEEGSDRARFESEDHQKRRKDDGRQSACRKERHHMQQRRHPRHRHRFDA